MTEHDANFCCQDTGISHLAVQQTMECHGSIKRESVDVSVPTVVFDKENLILFYPTSPQGIGLGGD
eukprot:625257-Ditylum_brightwellii.AAC.1